MTKQLSETPHCTLDDIGMDITGEDAGPILEAMEAYLNVFAPPAAGKCLKCDARISGILGAFMWGMENGEGSCSNCNWPARGHHYPKMPDGSSVFEGSRPIVMVLQYHPDNVTFERDADDA